METIRKKVNLNDAIIRLSGCTVPYIGVSDDSLGKIYYDISGSTYVRMKTVARTYNRILNIIREGVKLNRKSNLSSCAETGSESKYVLAEEFDINRITCEGIVYGIHSINSFDKINETEYETHIPLQEDSEDSIVLIDVEDEDSAKEIKEKLLYCYRILFCGEKHDREYVIPSLSVSYELCYPYIEIPLALNQDIADLGHMTDYQDEWNEFPNKDGISIYSGDTYTYTTDSKLQFLRSKKLYTDDDGNLLPGLFEEEGKLWKYTYDGKKWSHLNQTAKFSGKTCGDGLSNGECVVTAATQTPKYYRTVSTDAIVQAMLSGASTGGSYYFYVKYKNDEETPMTIPFTVGVVDGNGISNISYDSDFVTFEYYYNDIQYKETYKYNTGQTMEIVLDGYENITIYYNEIDYDFTKQTIYNKHYGVEREGNLADIVQYREGHVWCDDKSNGYVASAETINAPIFKEEYLLGISSTFKADVNVTINRGNAAAFERHFKLSECNTMEDLEAMGNGQFFNL